MLQTWSDNLTSFRNGAQDEYRQKIAAARQKAPRGPWATTAETMKAIREGEED